jgi:glycosyltransferase involved in cell wall biosynthesis
MKLAIETIAYKEERFLPKFIAHYQNKVDEIVILNSTIPWQGEVDDTPDKTGNIGRSLGATVIEHSWVDETSQRNAGLDYLSDVDWVIVVDPDEFISDEDWDKLYKCLEKGEAPAYVVEHQRVFYKHSEVFPHKDYQQIIAVRPTVRFVDKRVVNSVYGLAPVNLLHFSWARTDEEVLSKISHYSHADELLPNWYEEVWLKDKKTNLHPKDPEVLSALIPAILPPEIEALDLWP